jgi:hypothetical protein
MLSIFTVLVLVVSLSACGSGAEQPAGGIGGTVTAGPTCPVETIDSPCPPGVWTGTVRATAADGTNYGTQTDAQGHYRLALPDGTYEVVPVIDGGGPPSASPVSVTVSGGVMQTLDLQVDTGIR